MKEDGRIINIGSCNADRMPFAGGAVYAISKSALLGLVQGLARDLAGRGITINNIQPGPVETEMNPANGELAEMLKKSAHDGIGVVSGLLEMGGLSDRRREVQPGRTVLGKNLRC